MRPIAKLIQTWRESAGREENNDNQMPLEVSKERAHVLRIVSMELERTYEEEKKREKLPGTRDGFNHHFTVYYMTDKGLQELDGYIRTGEYPDGRLGEIFLTIGKEGDSNSVYDQWAIAVSMGLQYGIPVRDLFGKFVGQRFSPAGGTNDPNFSQCTSIVDYIARWIIAKYGDRKAPDVVLEEKKRQVNGT